MKLQATVPFIVRNTSLFMCEEDRENEVELIEQSEITKAESLAAGKTCKATLFTYSILKKEAYYLIAPDALQRGPSYLHLRNSTGGTGGRGKGGVEECLGAVGSTTCYTYTSHGDKTPSL